jgi:imidazole glycerol phosphate synthase subunit HisF
MSFKICATVLIDDCGNAIQSYNFNTKRVLGNLEKVLKFLNAYEIDEIHAIVPSKGKNSGNSLKIFSKLSGVSISTPLGIGGGLTKDNVKEITKDPFFERCIFNTAIFGNASLLQETRSIMGHQAMVGSMPFSLSGNILKIYNSGDNSWVELDRELWKKVNNNFNEILLLDSNAEGNKKGFDFEVFKYLKFPVDRVLISGGITKNDISKAKKMGLSGVSIDNFSLHTEYSIRQLR